jgi:hypothetical protein
MTENPTADVPESFDPKQPDLPTLAVDPNPIPDSQPEGTRLDPVEGAPGADTGEGGTLPAT